MAHKTNYSQYFSLDMLEATTNTILYMLYANRAITADNLEAGLAS